ncbi:MAG: 30S ribosomal protein S20 [Planctomycetaceae bacterium]|nr:30S ribosomal protein S20 [Planctomycetaceae bacterium]
MPNNPNAAKASRQNDKRRLRNRAAKTSLRTTLKKVRDAAATGDAPAIGAALGAAVKKLDKAATKKFIHKNKAARLKSRLSALARKSTAAARS